MKKRNWIRILIRIKTRFYVVNVDDFYDKKVKKNHFFSGSTKHQFVK